MKTSQKTQYNNFKIQFNDYLRIDHEKLREIFISFAKTQSEQKPSIIERENEISLRLTSDSGVNISLTTQRFADKTEKLTGSIGINAQEYADLKKVERASTALADVIHGHSHGYGCAEI